MLAAYFRMKYPNVVVGIDTHMCDRDQRIELVNKTINVFKTDIEGAEWQVLEELDVDYMCKYVKQILLETHPSRMDAVLPSGARESKLLLR